MKKLIAMLLALTLVVAFAGCDNKTEEPKVETVDALVALQTVWTSYGDEEKFSVMGGGYENVLMGEPGAIAGTDEASLTQQLLVPAAEVANVKGAASLFHAMNQNTFTCGAINLVDGADYAAFAKTLRDAIQGNQWMCGFPEKLVISNVGNCLVVAFGNGEMIDIFSGKLTAAYSNAASLYNEPMEGF